ncbi:olfactory receptor 56B1-like [Rhinophrynus dorsalis]
MDSTNLNQTSSFSYTEFILVVFPGIPTFRQLLVIPFLSTYLVILIFNMLIVYKVWVEEKLHSPMYVLISLLLGVNVICTTAVIPKMLLVLVGVNRISLVGCLVQMFSVYSIFMFKSVVILLMALDRYMAICRPLRYHDIVTKRLLVQLSIIGLVRNSILVAIVVILASRVKYCKSNILMNFACENMVLLSLGCGDMSKIQIVGLMVRTFATASDVTVLLLSYIKVLHTAMKLAAGSARTKALHTCSTHLLVALIMYSFGFISSIISKVEASISYDIQNLYGAVYFLFPALVNPIIYGLRVKEIKDCLEKPWKTKCSSTLH